MAYNQHISGSMNKQTSENKGQKLDNDVTYGEDYSDKQRDDSNEFNEEVNRQYESESAKKKDNLPDKTRHIVNRAKVSKNSNKTKFRSRKVNKRSFNYKESRSATRRF